MISVVVVGRNDNHGYNLSKRVSSSLNSIARMLSEDDEIIFVDWNTPTGYPVMPISIQDDLLPKTKSLLRIIRVPESVHQLVSDGSNRALIEPIARNVGISRVSTNCKWILSTNTDILFASPSGKNFQEILRNLNESLWLTFRFEIPEFLWDDLDRRNPESTSMQVLEWYRDNRVLNRIRVDSASDASFPIPDGVGDFQLASKNLWTKSTGFPEDMKKGWHVDTRLTLQMARISENKPQLVNELDLVIFHQNHLRNSTAYHGASETNSLSEVKKPYMNSASWGLSNIVLEEIRLQTKHSEISHFFEPSQYKNEDAILETSDLSEISKRLDYNLPRTQIFLEDEISILAKHSLVHCYSVNNATVLELSKICEGYEIKIEFMELNSLKKINRETQNTDVALLILDYGVESHVPIVSNFYGGQKNQEVIGAGWIAMNTGQIANHYLNPNLRVAVIRAQNWASRELARKYFSLPLFNNYTSVLSGQKRISPKFTLLEESVLLGGLIADYGLEIKSNQGWSSSPIHNFRLKLIASLIPISKLLPAFLRIPLKHMVKLAFKI